MKSNVFDGHPPPRGVKSSWLEPNRPAAGHRGHRGHHGKERPGQCRSDLRHVVEDWGGIMGGYIMIYVYIYMLLYHILIHIVKIDIYFLYVTHSLRGNSR